MDTVKFIKNYTLFQAIPESVLKKSFANMKREKFSSRTVILDSYSKNDCLYLILEGKVRVVAEDERGVKVDIDNLRAGDCFGEMYLLSGDPQPFYIESITDLELLLIKRDALFDLLGKFPGLHHVFYQILLRRLHHISHMKEKEIKEELEVVAADVVVTSKILSHKEEILKFLDEINLLLDSEGPFGKQLDSLTQKIAKRFDLSLCAIFLKIKGKDFFWLQAVNEKIFKGNFHQEFSEKDPVVESLTQNRQALNLDREIIKTTYPTSILNKNLGFNGFYCYPIMDKGKLIAFILLGDDKPLTNAKEIGQTLELFAGHLAVKIYQVQQVKENRWRKLELISLHRISRKLLSYDNIEDLLFELVKLAADATKAKGCVLRLMDKKAEHLKIVAYWGVGKEIAENTTQKIGSGVAGWVAEKKASLIINDISSDKRFENNIKTIAHSLLVVPLINQREAIGTLTVFDKDTREQVGSHDFNDDDRTLLESLAVQATVAIINTRLKQQAESALALKHEKFQDKVGLLGESKKVKHFNRKLFEAAQDDDAVLIHGEAGGGKLFTAQSLHNLSPRRDNVLVEYDCANLLPEKWGDEIFGYFHRANKESDQGVL